MAQTQADSKSDPVVLAAELRPLLARNAAQVERDRRFVPRISRLWSGPTCSD